MNSILIPTVFSGALLLSSCSGGGGDTGNSGDGDNTSPAVSSVTPSDGANAVALGVSISATFNEDIFAQTVTGSSVNLKQDGSEVASTVNFDSQNSVVTVSPDNGLTLLSDYSVSLTGDITDLSGNSLSPTTWTFSTRDGSWNTAQTVESNSNDTLNPQVAVDADGNAIAVWEQLDGSVYNIWYNRFQVGSGWGTAQLLETDDTGDASAPQVAFDGNGNAMAVWEQKIDDGTGTGTLVNSIHAKRYSASGSWGSVQLVEQDDTGAAYSPQLAFDSSGNAAVVWEQSDGTRYNIRTNRYDSVAGSWGSAETIETENFGDARNPQIDFDGSGNAVAVWHQGDGTRTNIHANRYDAVSGSWGTAEKIETSNQGNAVAAQIEFDDSGNALAVWQQDDGSVTNIRANRYTTAGWGSAQTIESNNSGSAYDPMIAVEGSGTALVVWEQWDGTRTNIWANRYSSGWGTETLIETSDSGDAGSQQVAIDSSGNALAVWSHTDASNTDNILANRYVAGTGWGTENLIESNDVGDAANPVIAMDSSGRAAVVWQQFDGTRDNIWSNRFD